MSDPSRAARRVVAVLGLSLLLLSDGLAGWSGGDAPTARAAGGADVPSVPSVTSMDDCVSGFDDTDSQGAMSLHGVALTSRGALAVGFTRAGEDDDFGKRRPASMWNVAGRWTRVPLDSPGDEDGLVAVTAAPGGTAWAAGFTTTGTQPAPLAMRWSGSGWKVDRPGPATPLASLFTDIVMVGTNPFAVGFRMTPSGRSEPIAARRDQVRWEYVSPRSGRRESMSLTGVADDGRGGLWVVGHGGPGNVVQPVILRRDDARWQRVQAPRLPGEAVLTDVAASGPREAWAVGYRQTAGRTLPLVLRWNGHRWAPAPPPDFHSPEVILTAVTHAPSGGIWTVGAAWDAAIGGYEAVAAWWDGTAWEVVASPDGGTELHDAVGSLDRTGWAVGRSGLSSSITRVCLTPGTGLSDASRPSPVPAERDELGHAPGGLTQASASEAGEGAAATATSTLAAARRGKDRGAHKDRRGHGAGRRDRSAHRASRHGPRGLPPATSDPSLLVRDVADEAGIAELTATYGAVVADFDGDGVDDLFIGRHGHPGRLVLDRDGHFIDAEAMVFPGVDRHGCAAADVDGSGLPDLYCAVGGKRGSGLKSNELWIDPGGPAPTEVAVERGVADPTGRGRRAVFLEAAGDPDIDLVLTNSPVRVDGLPSVGRLMRTRGDGHFTTRPTPGFAARLGALSLQDADYDADGREDLLLVTGGPQAPRQEGTRLYRNTPRGLVDVTRQVGIRSFGEIDAELVDLDHDDRLDLVQLAPTRLRVSHWRNGRFRPVYERRLTEGRAISGGDVNADGKDDLYIVRADGGRTVPDVLLVNRDAGGAWTSLPIPQAGSGRGDDAVAIDYDGNGLEDFVVLNGNNARGPIQLIAFYDRPAASTPTGVQPSPAASGPAAPSGSPAP
jgi:hypothetical protein